MNYLDSTYFFDFENETVKKLIFELKNSNLSYKEKSIEIYNTIRDDWRYDPNNPNLKKESFKSSAIATKNSGNCIEKSILLISSLRAMGIPARMHLGKVKNHLAVEKLIEKFGTNEMTPHGMLSAFINNKWVKMSPAFNKSLCEKYEVEPLDFDGENDSFLQKFNSNGSRFMEYTEDYGYFEDVPFDFIINNLKTHYPQIFNKGDRVKEYKI